MELEGKQSNLLAKCLHMILAQGVCPETKPTDWVRILLFAHTKGYLFTNHDTSAFVLCYRVPEVSEKWTDAMPENEVGRKLYVAFAVSEKKSPKTLLRMLKQYPDIDEAYWYHRGNNNDLRHYKIRRQK